jgi:opacity protein-like surface antigen
LAGIGYRPAGSKLSYGIDAAYHRFNQKAFTDGNANVFIAMARLDYDLSPNAYLIGGLGLVRNENKANVNGTEFTNTNSDAAFTAGAGFNFGKSLFVEGRLINVFSDPSARFIPITLGVRF